MPGELISFYIHKAYSTLVFTAMQGETISASELGVAIECPLKGKAITELFNEVLTSIDTIDLEHKRPRLSSLVVKTRDEIPVRKWTTIQLQLNDHKLSFEEADQQSREMTFPQRKDFWKDYVETVYRYWTTSNL